MAKMSVRSIYRQNDKLEEQLQLWHFMDSEERGSFIDEIETFVVAVKQIEHSAKDKLVKAQLRNIIEIWDEFLNDPTIVNAHDLAIIAELHKTSSVPKTRPKVPSIRDTNRNVLANIFGHIPEPLSKGKVDPNSFIPNLRDSKLRAIQEELYGIIDSQGHSE